MRIKILIFKNHNIMSNSSYHFSGSKTSVSLDEPLFLTKFIVTFILPQALQSRYGTQVLTEQCTKITGLNLDKMPEVVEQVNRGVSREFIGTIADTKVHGKFTFVVNVSPDGTPYPLNILRDWAGLCYSYNTGSQTLKRDYSGQCIIEIHAKDGTLIRAIKFPIFFPMTPPNEIDLDSTQDNIYELEMEFVCENGQDLLTNTQSK
jgi:hypothetical protein